MVSGAPTEECGVAYFTNPYGNLSFNMGGANDRTLTLLAGIEDSADEMVVARRSSESRTGIVTPGVLRDRLAGRQSRGSRTAPYQ